MFAIFTLVLLSFNSFCYTLTIPKNAPSTTINEALVELEKSVTIECYTEYKFNQSLKSDSTKLVETLDEVIEYMKINGSYPEHKPSLIPNSDALCLILCTYNRMGMLNENGEFNMDIVKEKFYANGEFTNKTMDIYQQCNQSVGNVTNVCEKATARVSCVVFGETLMRVIDGISGGLMKLLKGITFNHFVTN